MRVSARKGITMGDVLMFIICCVSNVICASSLDILSSCGLTCVPIPEPCFRSMSCCSNAGGKGTVAEVEEGKREEEEEGKEEAEGSESVSRGARVVLLLRVRDARGSDMMEIYELADWIKCAWCR